jgi:protein-S-isoprenylcysteine O-methyltransferase Ste14
VKAKERPTGDSASDPIDHQRTTQPLAGETMKNTAKAPRLAFVAVAVVAFVVCLASFAIRQVNVGIGAAIVALLAAGAALAWLSMEARRVRQVQRERSSTRGGARLRR